MRITVDDVKALRQETGHGVAVCMRVLNEVDGDLSKAKEILSHQETLPAPKSPNYPSAGTGPGIAETRAPKSSPTAPPSDTSPPLDRTGAPTKGVIFLVCGGRLGVIPSDQATLMIDVADAIAGQSSKMTQQAERLQAMTAFTGRLREAMGAAPSSAVRLDIDSAEGEIATFLLRQARAHVALAERTRFRHTCAVCGMTIFTNPEYEQARESQRKKDAATKGIGFGMFSTAAPIIMASSFLALRTQKPDYHCPRCQAMNTDEDVVVFCPRCKSANGGALLKRCTKCGHDFTAGVDVENLWRGHDIAAVPAQSGEKLTEFTLDDQPTLLEFLQDGTRMLTASWARSVRMWDIGNSGEPQPLWTHAVGGVVKASRPIVAVSPDGKWVAVAKPQSPRVRLLHASDGSQGREFLWSLADGGNPTDVAFTADSRELVVGNNDLEVWPLDGPRRFKLKVGGFWASGNHVACSTDGTYVAAAAGSHLYFWELAGGKPVGTLKVSSPISAMAWSPAAATLAIGLSAGGARGLAFGSGVQLVSMPALSSSAPFVMDAPVTDVAVSPDGAYLAAASRDHSARVFRIADRAEVARVSRPAEVTAVAFAPDGRLAIGDAANTVQFWAPPTMEDSNRADPAN